MFWRTRWPVRCGCLTTELEDRKTAFLARPAKTVPTSLRVLIVPAVPFALPFVVHIFRIPFFLVFKIWKAMQVLMVCAEDFGEGGLRQGEWSQCSAIAADAATGSAASFHVPRILPHVLIRSALLLSMYPPIEERNVSRHAASVALKIMR